LHEAQRIVNEDADGFESVFILVDVDEHASLGACLTEAAKGSVQVVVSNPCFEVWLLWHFEDLRAHQSSEWLRRRLRHYGEGLKTLSPKFPFHQYGVAVQRADGRRCGEIGQNPSSAMATFVDQLAGG
jgi:hypothetical protein